MDNLQPRPPVQGSALNESDCPVHRHLAAPGLVQVNLTFLWLSRTQE